MKSGRGARRVGAPLGGPMTGFTLLEIMVAMLLLAVIVTSSVSLLFINIRGWDGLVSDSEKALDETLINERLTTALHYLSPRVWQSGGEKRLAFSGEHDRVHFISRAPLQFRAGGLFEYLLVQEFDRDNRPGLVLYYAPYRPDRDEFTLPEGAERRLLFADTGGVRFSYLGSKGRNGKSRWWERWEEGAENYPKAVRIAFDGVAERNRSTRYVRLLTAGAGASR